MKWTESDKQKLRSLSGMMSNREIARRMGRTETSIKCERHYLGLAKETASRFGGRKREEIRDAAAARYGFTFWERRKLPIKLILQVNACADDDARSILLGRQVVTDTTVLMPELIVPKKPTTIKKPVQKVTVRDSARIMALEAKLQKLRRSA